MKNIIIFIIFSFGLSLYGGSDLFPFGMNHGLSQMQNSFETDQEFNDKYKNTMELCAQAGIKWWRAQNTFRWYNIQPDNLNEWDFKTEDSLVKWAKEYDLNLLPEIGFTADPARHDDTYDSANNEILGKGQSRQYPPDPDYWDEYEKYIDTLVKRYKNDIKYWQFSNEPDGGGHTGFLGNPAQYIEMLRHTIKALKTADPNAKIVGFDMCTPRGEFDWEYFDPDSGSIEHYDFGYQDWEDAIKSLIDSIGFDSIDVISQHLYMNAQDFNEKVDTLRTILESYPEGEYKPIWITEQGYKNSSSFESERGTDNPCSLTSFATYSSDSGEAFWETVCVTRDDNEYNHYDTIDTFLNIGDTVILEYRTDWWKQDTIIYNGGPLIYRKVNRNIIATALDSADTLIISKKWARETENYHNPTKQNLSYYELLEENNQLENLKIFFFTANSYINKHYYPPKVAFGNKPNDTTYEPTKYYWQRRQNVWSVIDTLNQPYPAYWTIRDKILSPRTPVIQDTTIEIDGIKTYQAESGISALDFTVEGNGLKGGKVAMEAGLQIYLGDGFEVEEGASFYAATNPLYREGGGTSSTKSITIPQNAKTSTQDKPEKEKIPKVFSCNQNFPNPFASSTLIKYGLPKDVDVKLEIFNLAGQKIHTLINGKQTAGYKQISWNGTTGSGTRLPQGVYFYTLKADDEFEKKYKMILLK